MTETDREVIRGLLFDIDGVLHVSMQPIAGLRGLLVCTGKHTADAPLLAQIHPDAILPSIVDLPQWLQQAKPTTENDG